MDHIAISLTDRLADSDVIKQSLGVVKPLTSLYGPD